MNTNGKPLPPASAWETGLTEAAEAAGLVAGKRYLAEMRREAGVYMGLMRRQRLHLLAMPEYRAALVLFTGNGGGAVAIETDAEILARLCGLNPSEVDHTPMFMVSAAELAATIGKAVLAGHRVAVLERIGGPAT